MAATSGELFGSPYAGSTKLRRCDALDEDLPAGHPVRVSRARSLTRPMIFSSGGPVGSAAPSGRRRDPAPPTGVDRADPRGGKILFPLDTRNCGGFMPLLTVNGDAAEGHFLPDFGGFMPIRQQARQNAALAAFRVVTDTDGVERTTALSHEVATDNDSPFEFFAALLTGGYDIMRFTPAGEGVAETWIALRDGSCVCHTTGLRRHKSSPPGWPPATLGSHRGHAPAVDSPRTTATPAVRAHRDSAGPHGVAGPSRQPSPLDALQSHPRNRASPTQVSTSRGRHPRGPTWRCGPTLVWR